jgi:ABC-type phosphate transport system substrate-binding protein
VRVGWGGEQVLDGPTLGDIWSGSIVWWNDTAIQTLNPTATMPQTRIQLAYANDTVGSISGAFGDALSIFNSDFAALWSASNTTLSKVVETFDLAVNTGSPGAQQPIYVKATPYSLSYSTLPIVNANGATSARMKNKAGARTRDLFS